MRTTPNERIEDLTQRGWWGEETLDTLLHTAVRASPDHLALVDQFNRIEFCDGEAQRLTFAEVGRAADNLAAAFFDSGLRQDDIVVVQLPNIAELAMIYLALGKLGVIISPVPVQYGPFELDKAQQLLEPAAFITLSNFKGKNFATEHGKVFTGDAIVFSFGEDVPKNAVAIALSTELPSKTGEYAAYIRNIDISANDIFTICWTSGTTGQPKGVPRSHIYQLIRSGQVRVNSGRTQPKYRLKAGDKVRVPPVRRRAPAAAPGTGEGLDWLAERIIFEDNRLLVVDKPAGLAVHGGGGLDFGLIEGLRSLRPASKTLELVHRLDRGTSGCILVAKKRSALRQLHALIREGAMTKRYLALVEGRWEHGVVEIDTPLRVGRDAGGGDDRYGSPRFNAAMEAVGLRRIFLHAHLIEFVWPESEEDFVISAPLPRELNEVLNRLVPPRRRKGR